MYQTDSKKVFFHMGLHWVVHTSRINSQSFNRRWVCQVHFTNINFGYRSPKAVGHSFQKIYHGCFVNLKVWPTDQQRPKNPGSRVASSAGEPLGATVIQTRWTVTNPSYSNCMILTPSGPIHYCLDGLKTVRTVWKLSGRFTNCPDGRLWKKFIKFRVFLNDGFPKYSLSDLHPNPTQHSSKLCELIPTLYFVTFTFVPIFAETLSWHIVVGQKNSRNVVVYQEWMKVATGCCQDDKSCCWRSGGPEESVPMLSIM